MLQESSALALLDPSDLHRGPDHDSSNLAAGYSSYARAKINLRASEVQLTLLFAERNEDREPHAAELKKMTFSRRQETPSLRRNAKHLV